MTVPHTSPTQDFLVRLRKIDRARITCRDVLVLWAVSREGGMMGREVAIQLGYKSRSSIQDGIARLLLAGLIEDRRIHLDRRTPNDLYILPAGEAILADIVPV